ncbi:hypothetical protein ISF6_3172 [Piscinibacter sakaiensis]|uniref:Uncharacterized protein n=1 Tax=Piscinibacter sakaiensis TaxID=1547922 RepID=A0A0K8P3X8_PISS1|nr:hypothetical protein ISF6_3172 [Piscinibacter sakaiensis]
MRRKLPFWGRPRARRRGGFRGTTRIDASATGEDCSRAGPGLEPDERGRSPPFRGRRGAGEGWPVGRRPGGLALGRSGAQVIRRGIQRSLVRSCGPALRRRRR